MRTQAKIFFFTWSLIPLHACEAQRKFSAPLCVVMSSLPMHMLGSDIIVALPTKQRKSRKLEGRQGEDGRACDQQETNML